MSEHTSTIPTGFRLTRRIRVYGLYAEQAKEISSFYARNPNVEWITFDIESGTMSAQYHGAFIGLDNILEVLAEYGVRPSLAFWDRVKLGWYRYGDKNTQDNAKLEPFCCSKLPPGK